MKITVLGKNINRNILFSYGITTNENDKQFSHIKTTFLIGGLRF